MKVVTTEQMRELERRAAQVGLSPEVLMANAGLAVAREVQKLVDRVAGCRILVLAGPGNNGGDGLVAARHLDDVGAEVTLLLYGARTEADPNYKKALERGIPVLSASSEKELAALDGLFGSSEVVIDALFGTGRSRPLEGAVKGILEKVRRAKESHPGLLIVALDLPSGLNADTGATDPACLQSDVTITLGYPKVGLFAFPGAQKVGKLIISGIGIPEQLAGDILNELMTPEWARATLPLRSPDANKGTFGRVLVIGGSINYIGAAYLACAAAIRTGAGLVTLATPRSLQPILAAKLTEVTYIPLPEAGEGITSPAAVGTLYPRLQEYDAVVLGCGLGQNPPTVDFVREMLFSIPSGCKLVIDADGLNTLAGSPAWWEKLPDAVVSPHPGEMSRLTGMAVSEIQANRFQVALETANRWKKTVVLKGAHTVVAAPGGKVRLSPFANAGLASAGTGDVLAGAIGGLLAQGLSLLDAAALGVYLHGMAAELVKDNLGDAGMIASDLLPALPLAIKKLKQSYM